MKKTKKQLLGLAGLAVVGIMTAIAAALPVPDAAAAETAGSSQTTKVQVLVGELNPSGVFTSPANNSATTKSIIPVSLSVSQVVKVEFRLVRRTLVKPSTRTRAAVAAGTPETMDEFLYECVDITTPTSTCAFDFDTDEWGGLGEYVIRAFITDETGATISVDTVAFHYAAVTAEYKGIDSDRDPILSGNVSTSISADVKRVSLAIFHRDGSALKDKDGKAMVIDIATFSADAGFLATLPFKKYGAKAGEYTAVVTAYNDTGTVLEMRTIDFDYSPVAPDTPNTGMFSASGLNISRVDYIVTGLIAFVLASGFALMLVYRKSRR